MSVPHQEALTKDPQSLKVCPCCPPQRSRLPQGTQNAQGRGVLQVAPQILMRGWGFLEANVAGVLINAICVYKASYQGWRKLLHLSTGVGKWRLTVVCMKKTGYDYNNLINSKEWHSGIVPLGTIS